VRFLGLAVAILFVYIISFLPVSAASGIHIRIEGSESTIFNGSIDTSGCSITDENGETKTISTPLAICALDAASKQGGFGYSFDDYSLGIFLNTVGGKSGGWFFWVNKQFSPVGYGVYELHSGDSLVIHQKSNIYPEEKVPDVPAQPTSPQEPEKAPQAVTQPQPAPPVTNQVEQKPAQPMTKAPEEQKKPPAQPPQAPIQPAKEEVKSQPPVLASKPEPVQPVLAQIQLSQGAPATATQTEVALSPTLPQQTEETIHIEEPILEEEVVEVTPIATNKKRALPKRLPQSGPREVVLVLGPISMLIGYFLRKQTQNPFARFLKPVLLTRRWYYHS